MSEHRNPQAAPVTRRHFLGGTVMGATWLHNWPRLAAAAAQKHQPSGQMTWATHVTMAPTWFDTAETPGVITPFMFLYALHDALVKPMPGNPMFPSLATGWEGSQDGLTYDFALRQGVKFHNDDPFTTFYGTPATGAAWIVPKKYVEKVGSEAF